MLKRKKPHTLRGCGFFTNFKQGRCYNSINVLDAYIVSKFKYFAYAYLIFIACFIVYGSSVVIRMAI